MAADVLPSSECVPLPTGGYECEFVDPIPDSLTCPVCLLAFRDPHLLDCCGIKICAACIGRIEAAGQPCPHCRERFMHILDKSINRQVLNRQVRCSRKKDGCEWEGQLRDLDKHEREECGWDLVQCRYQCGGRIPRRQIEQYEREECPQRSVDAKLESYMRKMEERHQREMDAVRQQMEQQQKEYEANMEHQKREMAELKEQMGQQKKEYDTKMAQQMKEYEDKMEQLEQLLQWKLRANTEQQMLKLRREVEDEVIPQCAMVKEMRAHLYSIPILSPCEFTMTNYSLHKTVDDTWYSPPFFTRQGGYKMCLGVHAKGCSTDAGTGLLMFVRLVRGEHDAKLRWPFQGVVTVHLLNQKRDRGHHENTVNFDAYAIAYGSAGRVTSGEYATQAQAGTRFISHTAVESITETTQYLHDDCLRWRVANIVVHHSTSHSIHSTGHSIRKMFT